MLKLYKNIYSSPWLPLLAATQGHFLLPICLQLALEPYKFLLQTLAVSHHCHWQTDHILPRHQFILSKGLTDCLTYSLAFLALINQTRPEYKNENVRTSFLQIQNEKVLSLVRILYVLCDQHNINIRSLIYIVNTFMMLGSISNS